MKWFKKNKKVLLIGAVVAAVLVFAFWYGGDAPGLRGWSVKNEQTQQIDAGKKDENRTASSESKGKTDKRDASGSADAEKDAGNSEKAIADENSKKAAEEAEAMKKAEEEAKKAADEAAKAAEEAKKKAEQAKTAEERKQAEEALKKAEADKKAAEEAAKKATEEAEAKKKAAEEAKAEEEKRQAEEARKKAEEEAEKKAAEDEGPKQEIDPETGKDKYNTDPVPEGKPIPVEPQDQEPEDEIYYCTFSISCATILNNMEYLNPEKEQCVPADGWILYPQTVAFSAGQNVYDVLSQICMENGIHMEASFTPMYNSVYVEGINNLYEFDCGQMSGWMYKVNEWFPNYGASRYVLQDGDVCCWVYTCDLGTDVGGGYAMGY